MLKGKKFKKKGKQQQIKESKPDDVKNRKILKVKSKNPEPKPETDKPKLEKEEKKDEEEEWVEDSDNENENENNPNQVRLEELLDDLKLDDNDEDTKKENELLVDDFIKKMENIKISKE